MPITWTCGPGLKNSRTLDTRQNPMSVWKHACTLGEVESLLNRSPKTHTLNPKSLHISLNIFKIPPPPPPGTPRSNITAAQVATNPGVSEADAEEAAADNPWMYLPASLRLRVSELRFSVSSYQHFSI